MIVNLLYLWIIGSAAIFAINAASTFYPPHSKWQQQITEGIALVSLLIILLCFAILCGIVIGGLLQKGGLL